jgi:hypothetical protein
VAHWTTSGRLQSFLIVDALLNYIYFKRIDMKNQLFLLKFALARFRGGVNLPQTPAVSMDRYNTGLEFTRRSFKAQGFSRALI